VGNFKFSNPVNAKQEAIGTRICNTTEYIFLLSICAFTSIAIAEAVCINDAAISSKAYGMVVSSC
jgi:hypothetical protein